MYLIFLNLIIRSKDRQLHNIYIYDIYYIYIFKNTYKHNTHTYLIYYIAFWAFSKLQSFDHR